MVIKLCSFTSLKCLTEWCWSLHFTTGHSLLTLPLILLQPCFSPNCQQGQIRNWPFCWLWFTWFHSSQRGQIPNPENMLNEELWQWWFFYFNRPGHLFLKDVRNYGGKSAAHKAEHSCSSENIRYFSSRQQHLSVSLGPVWNILTTVRWIAVKFSAALCNPQKRSNRLGDVMLYFGSWPNPELITFQTVSCFVFIAA